MPKKLFLELKLSYMFISWKQTLPVPKIFIFGKQNTYYINLFILEIKIEFIFPNCPKLVDLSVYNELQEIYVT